MMAISVEHLSAQVQCPHCAAVVQTPPRSALGPPPGPDPLGAQVQSSPQPPSPTPAKTDPDSIFSDAASGDDFQAGPATPMPATMHDAPFTAGEDAVAAPSAEEEPVDLSAMRG